MHQVINFPVGWFDDEHSRLLCIHYGKRIIKSSEWVYSCVIPTIKPEDVCTDPDVVALHFVYRKHNFWLIHPDIPIDVAKRKIHSDILKELHERINPPSSSGS